MSGPRDTTRARFSRYRDRIFFETVNAALYECADQVRAHAHQSISAGSASGKRHQPSAPGEPPHRDTGHLQAHLETTQPKPLTGRVTSHAAYSTALELGTSKMQARSFMRPARDAVTPRAEKILARRLKAALRRRNR